MIRHKEQIRTENILRSIVKDYIYVHEKFPKRVRTPRKEFILYEHDLLFQCTIYHEDSEYKRKNLITLQSFIFVWGNIIKLRRTPLLRLKNDRSNNSR